jgi:hypothetical protein
MMTSPSMLTDILPAKNLLSDDIPVSELAKQVLENVSSSETKNVTVVTDEIILAKASSKEIKAIYDMPKEEAISTFIGKPEVGDQINEDAGKVATKAISDA